MGNAESPEHWRDNHYEVTGPVVAEIQGIFMDNWLKTSGTVLNGPEYFPPLAPTGSYLAQAFKSSPRQGDIDMHLMYLLAIASAPPLFNTAFGVFNSCVEILLGELPRQAIWRALITPAIRTVYWSSQVLFLWVVWRNSASQPAAITVR